MGVGFAKPGEDNQAVKSLHLALELDALAGWQCSLLSDNCRDRRLLDLLTV